MHRGPLSNAMGRGSRYLFAKSFMECLTRMKSTCQHVGHPRLRENSFLGGLMTDVTLFLLAVTEKFSGLSPDPYCMSLHPCHRQDSLQPGCLLSPKPAARVPLGFPPLIFKNSHLLGPGATQDSFPLDFLCLIKDLDYICKSPFMLSDMMSS